MQKLFSIEVWIGKDGRGRGAFLKEIKDVIIIVSKKNCNFKTKIIMAFEEINVQENLGIQTIKLPDNFKINDDKVYLKKVGNALYIIPFHNPWQNLLDSIEEFSDDFMNARNQPIEQIRNLFD